MTRNRALSLAAILALAALALTVLRHPHNTQESAYLPAPACAGCHMEIARTYRETAMGRSFHVPGVADLARLGGFKHEKSGRFFEMFSRDGHLFQKRWEIAPDGSQRRVVELQVHFVLGSGNHSRGYLHRTLDGHLIQLPLAWYAEKGGFWAMNPGYDRADHRDFRRTVTFDCLFCHNGYGPMADSPAKPGDEAVFPEKLAEGVDCQRCHGPGRIHAEAAAAGKPPQQVRAAIVNPKRLNRDLQMDVCMQCHLETTSRTLPYSVVRYERPFFSYRPGQPLGRWALHFDHPAGVENGKFEIAHAAYRLRKSACFNKSRMTCTTCHNPHVAAHGEKAITHYKSACLSCHQQSHRKDENCLACHMPKRRTDDVVHVVMTDHYIQRRKPDRDLLAPLAEKHDSAETAYRGEVVPYYPLPMSDELYIAVAQVTEGSNLDAGLPRLEAAIRRNKPAEAMF